MTVEFVKYTEYFETYHVTLKLVIFERMLRRITGLFFIFNTLTEKMVVNVWGGDYINNKVISGFMVLTLSEFKLLKGFLIAIDIKSAFQLKLQWIYSLTFNGTVFQWKRIIPLQYDQNFHCIAVV